MRHFFGSVFVQEDDHIELEYYIQENGGSYGIEIKSSKPTHSGFEMCIRDSTIPVP